MTDENPAPNPSAPHHHSMRTGDLGDLAAWVSWVDAVRRPTPSELLKPRRAPLPTDVSAVGGPFHSVTAATLGEVELMPGWAALRPPGIASVALPRHPSGDTATAMAAGAQAADGIVDSGADLVIPVLTQLGPVTYTAAAAAISTLVPQEPAWVLGFERRTAPGLTGSPETCYLDDPGWIRRCIRVRDLSWRARDLGAQQLLEQLNEPVFSAVVGLLLRLVERGTPVLLDGPVTAAAALVTSRIDHLAADSYFAPHRHGDAAERYALDAMGLEPVAPLGLRLGHGIGALAVLPLLQAVLAP